MGIRRLITLDSPYTWTRTSQRFWEILRLYARREHSICEVGSSTGHISFRLAKSGYQVTLLDIRPEPIAVARDSFSHHGLSGSFLCEDFISHQDRYDFIWSSGLVQCLDDGAQSAFINHAAELSGRLLLFYPDTDSGLKKLGSDSLKVPGVDGATEYSVSNVALHVCSCYSKVYSGRISGASIGMPFDMLWTYGEN